MPVNFGTLQPIAAPQVVGSLPTVNSGNVDPFSGLLAGMAKGQDMAAQRLQMQQTQQNMRQSAALHPLEMLKAQAAIEQAKAATGLATANTAQTNQAIQQQGQLFPSQLEKAKQDAVIAANNAKITNYAVIDAAGKASFKDEESAKQYAAAKSEAATKGETYYIASLNPPDRTAYLTSKANLEQSIASARSTNADADQKEADAAAFMKMGWANIASEVMQEKDPTKQQQMYSTWVKTLPENQQKLLEKGGFSTWDQQKGVVLKTMGTLATADYTARHAKGMVEQKDNRTDLAKAQDYTNQLQAQYDDAVKRGDKVTADRLQDQINQSKANEQGTIKTPDVTKGQSNLQQQVDYVNGLKQEIDKLPPGSPEQKAAQDKYDLAITQLKSDKGLWDQIKSSIAGAVGSTTKGILGVGSPRQSTGQPKMFKYNPATGKLE